MSLYGYHTMCIGILQKPAVRVKYKSPSSNQVIWGFPISGYVVGGQMRILVHHCIGPDSEEIDMPIIISYMVKGVEEPWPRHKEEGQQKLFR